MDAWISLFSKFSHEALLFEAFILFIGICGYSVFYLTRKRKYGVAGKDVPENIIKHYLAQLVVDAEEMRNQLFGLLGKGEVTARLMTGTNFPHEHHAAMPPVPSSAPGATVTADPRLQEKLHDLEKRLAEQAGALDSVLNEKMKIEEELANAKAEAKDAAAAVDTSGSGSPDRSGPLQERVKQLEAQLAEYAIIEDDLANLKRLQKENKTLKQQLADASGGALAAPAPAAVPAPVPAATPVVAAAESPVAPVTEEPADFEALVDVVEKNLANTAEPANAEPLETSPAAVQIPSEQIKDEKSEEQLQADFEKMLNS